jgi:hypothetical protein
VGDLVLIHTRERVPAHLQNHFGYARERIWEKRT